MDFFPRSRCIPRQVSKMVVQPSLAHIVILVFLVLRSSTSPRNFVASWQMILFALAYLVFQVTLLSSSSIETTLRFFTHSRAYRAEVFLPYAQMFLLFQLFCRRTCTASSWHVFSCMVPWYSAFASEYSGSMLCGLTF